MKKIIGMAAAWLSISPMLHAQESTSVQPFQLSGYAEMYYTHDFNNPKTNTRPGFIYSHHRNNEVNINLALVKGTYTTENVRANLALAAGTYMSANYAAEPHGLQNIYEANVGVKLSAKHNLWLDAGIFSSHLGLESAVGLDNWALTRSLSAENSPYFETGAKVSYTTADGRWLVSGLLLNGWQRIQRVDGNTTPAFGHQIQYKPNAEWTLNSSSFVGNDKVDSLRLMRYFHNFYAIYQPSAKLGFTIGFDIGLQQEAKGSSNYHMWYAPLLLLKYAPVAKLSMTARAEYYSDKHGIIIAGADGHDGFKTFGYSMNVDYAITDHVVWRSECRNLHSRDPLFVNSNAVLITNSPSVTTAIAVRF